MSRDDYIAVQHMINNAKYGGKSILPELRVIESGVLKDLSRLALSGQVSRQPIIYRLL